MVLSDPCVTLAGSGGIARLTPARSPRLLLSSPFSRLDAHQLMVYDEPNAVMFNGPSRL